MKCGPSYTFKHFIPEATGKNAILVILLISPMMKSLWEDQAHMTTTEIRQQYKPRNTIGKKLGKETFSTYLDVITL